MVAVSTPVQELRGVLGAMENGDLTQSMKQVYDGTWDEPEFTGTGFPCVFYLRYHYYPIYFPLMALSRWARSGAARHAEALAPALRVVREQAEPRIGRKAVSV